MALRQAIRPVLWGNTRNRETAAVPHVVNKELLEMRHAMRAVASKLSPML
jgi:hypothetical protein